MNTRWQRSSQVVARRIGDETVLVPIRGERGDLETLFRLDPVASLIWDQLAEPCTTEALVTAVTENFAVEAEAARRDLEAFLAELNAAELAAPAGTSS